MSLSFLLLIKELSLHGDLQISFELFLVLNYPYYTKLCLLNDFVSCVFTIIYYEYQENMENALIGIVVCQITF